MRSLVPALVAVAGIGVVVAAVILSPSGLASRPVSSVPPLLSEPAGLPGAGLSLAPDGLGAVAFGDEDGPTLEALTDLLGTPVEDVTQPCDAGTEPVRSVRWGGLTVALVDGAFTGYIIGVYVPPDSPALQVETEEGIAAGDMASELTAAYGDRLAWTAPEETGFGESVEAFGIDGYAADMPAETGMGGFVEGGREDGRVITIIAGQPCGRP